MICSTSSATLRAQRPATARRSARVCAPVASITQESKRSDAKQANWFQQGAIALAASAVILAAGPAAARLEGVNNPQLLPPGPPQFAIDVAGFLTKGELSRVNETLKNLEKDTGFRVRLLSQAYPNTPGLAIKDYWAVDGNTVVFVADPNTGNILNFNVGESVDFAVPRNFWTRVAGKYGTKFYWKNNGEASAILQAVNAIDVCLREPIGVGQCAKIA